MQNHWTNFNFHNIFFNQKYFYGVVKQWFSGLNHWTHSIILPFLSSWSRKAVFLKGRITEHTLASLPSPFSFFMRRKAVILKNRVAECPRIRSYLTLFSFCLYFLLNRYTYREINPCWLFRSRKGCRQPADVCERVGTGRSSPHTQVDILKGKYFNRN